MSTNDCAPEWPLRYEHPEASPSPDLAHLSDEEQLIALLKAAPDGLTSMQLGVLLPGSPRRQSAALRAASTALRIIATAERRPNRAVRGQRQNVYRPAP